MILKDEAKRFGLDFPEEKVLNAIDNVIHITKRNIIKFQDFLPNPVTNGGIYKYYKFKGFNCTWEHGFWCGLVWLCYEVSQDYKIKCYAERIVKMFYELIPKNGLGHNDLGFWVIPSCVPFYNLSKNIMVKELVIDGADSMLTRYDSKNHILMSHSFEHDSNVLTLKISVLSNAMLFNLAYILTGSTKYKEAFFNNIKIVIDNNILPSGETYFFSYFNAKTRLPDKSFIPHYAQSEEDSTKIRSYAWAMHGLAMMYSITGDKYYEEKFDIVYSYLHSIANDIENFFYVSVTSPKSGKDSSSISIILCSLIEILRNEDVKNREKYVREALFFLNRLIDEFAANYGEGWEGLLKHAHVYRKDKEYNYSCMHGDYFYAEALINSIKDIKSYWYNLS